MAAPIGGLDGFVFTGGIGEHATPIRALVADRLRWLGKLDLRMILTDEEAMITRHTLDTLPA